jgi:hypothetical protein
LTIFPPYHITGVWWELPLPPFFLQPWLAYLNWVLSNNSSVPWIPLTWTCDSWLVLTCHHFIKFNISLLHLPMRKSKQTLILGCHSACFRLSPSAAQSWIPTLIWVTRTIWSSGPKPGCPLGFSLREYSPLACVLHCANCFGIHSVLGTLFDPCRLAYLTYTSNDSMRPPLAVNFLTKCTTEICLRCQKRENRLSFPTFIPASSIWLGQEWLLAT